MTLTGRSNVARCVLQLVTRTLKAECVRPGVVDCARLRWWLPDRHALFSRDARVRFVIIIIFFTYVSKMVVRLSFAGKMGYLTHV